MITSFFTTGDQRLAVLLATCGIEFYPENPVTVERTLHANGNTETRTNFHFQQDGTWTDFSGQAHTHITCDQVAAAYYNRPSSLPPQVLCEIAIIKSCLLVRDYLNKVRKAANPEESYIGVAVCENASLLCQLAESAKELTKQKIRGGILYAPTERLDEAYKLFSSFK